MLKFKIRIFLSYSIKDESLARKFANEIRSYPSIDVFMAPDDITAGTIWQNELKYQVKNCDAVFALITENFHEADWTEQEMGLAWAFDKKVIGVTPDGTEGKGYVNKFQIESMTGGVNYQGIANLVLDFYPEIDNTNDFVEQLVEYNLPNSKQFIESNAIYRVIRKYTNQLDESLSEKVFQSFTKNPEVKGAFEWIDSINGFLRDENTFFTLSKDNASKILQGN